jgi:hypothetical protein
LNLITLFSTSYDDLTTLPLAGVPEGRGWTETISTCPQTARLTKPRHSYKNQNILIFKIKFC